MATIISFLLALHVLLVPASTATTVKGKTLQPVKPKTEVIGNVVSADIDGI